MSQKSDRFAWTDVAKPGQTSLGHMDFECPYLLVHSIQGRSIGSAVGSRGPLRSTSMFSDPVAGKREPLVKKHFKKDTSMYFPKELRGSQVT